MVYIRDNEDQSGALSFCVFFCVSTIYNRFFLHMHGILVMPEQHNNFTCLEACCYGIDHYHHQSTVSVSGPMRVHQPDKEPDLCIQVGAG